MATMKFDIEIPEWANWLSSDQGGWYAWEFRPSFSSFMYYYICSGKREKLFATKEFVPELYKLEWS